MSQSAAPPPPPRRCAWIVAVWLLLTHGAVAADFEFNPATQRAYAELMKLRVSAARRYLSPELARTNGVAVYLDNFGDVLTLLTTDDRTLYGKLEKRQADRLDALEALDDRSPWQRFARAEVRLHWAFVKLKFGHEVSACWDVVRAYRLLEENRRRFPDFVPTYKSLGALHVLIGSVPTRFAGFVRLMGLKGSVGQGMLEVQDVARRDTPFRNEARLIELLLKGYVLSFTPEDAARTRALVHEHPDNLMFALFGAGLLLKDARSEEALAVLENRPQGPDYLPYPFVQHQLGEIQLQKGHYAAALGHYRAFLGHYNGVNFRKDAHVRQFLCLWLLGRDAQALAQLRLAQTTGSTGVEADRAAQKLAETFLAKGLSARHKVLFKARFACDGGYFDAALGLLLPYAEKDFAATDEKAEFQYRKGRIYQKQQKPAAAVPHFERAIALSEAGQLAFGALSALQLGYLYREQRNEARARQFFEKALQYDDHEYKTSVDNKARAALAR